MSKIIDNIWIGNYNDSCNEQFLKKHKITHILCCAKEYTELSDKLVAEDYTYYRLPIVEEPVGKRKFNAWFRKGAAKINEWVSKGHKVLVHCAQGISRSVSTVITYLILYKGYTYDKAFTIVKKHRSIMNPYGEFIPVVKGFEKSNYMTRKNRNIL